MLGIRDVHAHGATRVSISGHHVLTGGADGVVSLYSTKQWPKSPALWSFNCHEGAVTDVVLADALELALSCGRDGHILLHENIFDTTKLVSRVICQVSGEVRCLQLDVERRRVFIAGDSLRCLDMAQDRFKIHTIPLIVPFPIVSLAVSPCGCYIAMASASGELGVVSTPTTSFSSPAASATTGTASVVSALPPKTQFLFRSVLSPSAKRDDTARYRMSWCNTKAGGLMLMVPTATEVQVYQLDDGASAAPARMRAVGGLHDRQLMDLHGALVYRVTKSRLACVMASRSGIFIGKVEAKSLAMSRHTSEQYSKAPAAATSGDVAVSDVQVNAASGDVVVGLADGRVSLLHKVSLKEWKATADTAVRDAAKTQEEDEEKQKGEDGEDKARNTKRHSSKVHTHRSRSALDNEDEDFIDDADDSADDTASESSADSSSSSSSSVASSGSGAAPEDFKKVVVDLQRSGASMRDNDEERPSRWRQDDAAAALAHAEREAERQRARSRFLDDEAEEGSTEDDEDEDEDRHKRAVPRAARHDLDEEDEAEDEDHYDDASVEGQVEGDEDAESRMGSGTARHHTTNASSASAQMLSGRLPSSAVQDYSFQVGATPAGEEGSCYLAYNSIGYIHCSREATTVHFHDISYPAVRLPLRDSVVMGSLSPVGAGFIVVPAEAAEAQNSVDEAPRLTVLYHAFTPLGAQSEWRVSLLPGETVRCMAAGIRFLAVATSHYLRIFSLSGLELAVLSKCQRIVTMVGTSSRKLMSSFRADFDPLAIVTLTGTGELQMEVIDVGARAAALPARTIPLTELPDGSTHQLQWLGWSEDGLLHTADTAGVVRMFTEDWGGSWVPVYDPRTLVDQSYALWVYGVSDSALLAYRYSRDDPSYPAAAASGLSTELVPLFLPLTRTMGEEGRERWDKVLRQQIRSDELKRHSAFYSATIAKYDEVHDHHLLQFFDNALKGQQTTRALELAMLMEIHDRVVKCAQMANNGGYAKLVPKLLALYEMRMAAKSKRRCTLPLKETVASDKKKDELLRKLLGQMLPQDKKGKVTESPAAEGSGTSAVTAVTVDDTEEAKRAEARERSPTRPSATMTTTTAAATTMTSPSAASTATTLVGAESPAKGSSTATSISSSARRHISFAREAAPTAAAAAAPTSASAVNSTTNIKNNSSQTSAALHGVSSVPHKMSNPFARPAPSSAVHGGEVKAASVVGPAPPPSAARPASTATHSIHQTRLGTAPSPSASVSFAHPSTALLGASQGSTPPRTMLATARPSTSSPPLSCTTSASVAAAESAIAQPPHSPASVAETRRGNGDGAATSPSPLADTPEDQRVSAGHVMATATSAVTASVAAPTAADDAVAACKSAPTSTARVTAMDSVKPSTGFVPRELPTHVTVAAPTSATPVDPFLYSHAEEATFKTATSAAGSGLRVLSGGTGAFGSAGLSEPAISVQSLLDVGHEETAPVVRSDSFGEALRKRYRDDEEDGDDMDEAPLAFVPKLAL